MLKSENLNLNLFEDADYVKPEFFNENTEILDQFLQDSAHCAFDAFFPIDLEKTNSVTFEFERMPVMLVILTKYGFMIGIRGHYEMFDICSGNNASYSVEVTWGRTSVTLTTSDCIQLTESDADPHYVALLV